MAAADIRAVPIKFVTEAIRAFLMAGARQTASNRFRALVADQIQILFIFSCIIANVTGITTLRNREIHSYCYTYDIYHKKAYDASSSSSSSDMLETANASFGNKSLI
ncbi:hypothetical protein V1504DRAFT_470659 [Lipomyces starkeyi]